MIKKTKKLLTISELSTLLNIKDTTIRKFIFYRKIPFIKVGRLIRFSSEDIQKWIEQMSTRT